MTEGTEETITDPEEVPAKRSRRGVPGKPRVPRKKPPPAYIQLSPALQSELRKLQHAAARGSSASAAEWAKVSKAVDKALTLLLPDKGPGSMEISTVYTCRDTENECETEKEQSDAIQWIHDETVSHLVSVCLGWILWPVSLWSPNRKVPVPRSAGLLSPHLPRPPTTTSLQVLPTFSPLSRLSYSITGTRKGIFVPLQACLSPTPFASSTLIALFGHMRAPLASPTLRLDPCPPNPLSTPLLLRPPPPLGAWVMDTLHRHMLFRAF